MTNNTRCRTNEAVNALLEISCTHHQIFFETSPILIPIDGQLQADRWLTKNKRNIHCGTNTPALIRLSSQRFTRAMHYVKSCRRSWRWMRPPACGRKTLSPMPGSLSPTVSIHRQSRWLYDCWPLKGACSQSLKTKIVVHPIIVVLPRVIRLDLNPWIVGSIKKISWNCQTSGVPQQSWGFTLLSPLGRVKTPSFSWQLSA